MFSGPYAPGVWYSTDSSGSTHQVGNAVKATIRLQTTEERAFAMATEGRGVPAPTAVVERVTEEEEAVAHETQQLQWAGEKLAAVRTRTCTCTRTRTRT